MSLVCFILIQYLEFYFWASGWVHKVCFWKDGSRYHHHLWLILNSAKLCRLGQYCPFHKQSKSLEYACVYNLTNCGKNPRRHKSSKEAKKKTTTTTATTTTPPPEPRLLEDSCACGWGRQGWHQQTALPLWNLHCPRNRLSLGREGKRGDMRTDSKPRKLCLKSGCMTGRWNYLHLTLLFLSI